MSAMVGSGLRGIVLGMIVLCVSAGAVAAVPGPNRLSNPSITPSGGTTETLFTFSVRYRSWVDAPALSVTASVAGITVPLALVSGTSTNGTYRGTSVLPAGSWEVSFDSVSESGNAQTVVAGPVSVAPAATPTAQPTSPPPATPTPQPTAPPPPPPAATPTSPAPAAVVPTAPPSAPSSAASPSGAPGGALPPSPSPAGVPAAGATDDVSGMGPLAVGGLVALAAIAGWWFLAARHPSDDEPAPLATAPPRTPAPAERPSPRPPAAWELASTLDDRPIGSVDDDAAVEVERQRQPGERRSGNARTRRMAEMHAWRDDTDRRSLLHRVGLPEDDAF